MKLKHLLFIPLAAFIALLIFGGYVASQILWPHPSDKQMEAKFSQHRQEFEQLVTMIQEDTQIDSVTIYDNDPVSPSDSINYDWKQRKPLISDDRLSEYQKLMRQIGVKRVSKKYAGPVHFLASFDSCCDEGHEWLAMEKGFVFRLSPPEKTQSSLENIDRNLLGTWHKQLEGNWYLYYSHSLGKPE